MLQYIHYEESDDMINYDYNHIDIAGIKIVKKYLESHELRGYTFDICASYPPLQRILTSLTNFMASEQVHTNEYFEFLEYMKNWLLGSVPKYLKRIYYNNLRDYTEWLVDNVTFIKN